MQKGRDFFVEYKEYTVQYGTVRVEGAGYSARLLGRADSQTSWTWWIMLLGPVQYVYVSLRPDIRVLATDGEPRRFPGTVTTVPAS